jgi:hypothetical protein
MVVHDVAVSVWQPVSSKQLKLEQILSLKTAQERPSLKGFATQYSDVMADIQKDEVRLSQLVESSQTTKFGVDDISIALECHKETLAKEIEICSQGFEKILDKTAGDYELNDITGLITKNQH